MKDGAQWGPGNVALLLRAMVKLQRVMTGTTASAHDLTLTLHELQAQRLARIAVWRMRRARRATA